ncbi:MAG: family transporter substrate-binding protein, partial [Microvirga sp.]|nr:family transporter substrate-binding protein [Microvirga sp.]
MFSGKVFGALAGAAVLALSATTAVAQPKDKIKIGFIYVGPVGDHGWSYQHDQGRQAIEKAFPGK